MEHWGYHLLLNCRSGNENIKNGEKITEFTKELVHEIDMKAYGDPQVVHFGKHDPKVSGYTLVQLIETSAITGHFVDHNGDFYIDIFSCKGFDLNKATEVVVKYFNPENIQTTFLTRQA